MSLDKTLRGDILYRINENLLKKLISRRQRRLRVALEMEIANIVKLPVLRNRNFRNFVLIKSRQEFFEEL